MSDRLRMSVEIDGLNEAIAKLNKYDTESSKKIRTVIRKSGKSVASQAQFRAPKRTGRLKKSIRAKFDNNYIESTVKANVPYGHLVEYGAASVLIRARRKLALRFWGRMGNRQFVAKGKSADKGNIKIPSRSASPFMRPSYESVKPRVINQIQKVLREMPND